MFTGPAEFYEDDVAIRLKLKKRGDISVQLPPARRVIRPKTDDRRAFVLDVHKDCTKFQAFIAAACAFTDTKESELFGTGRIPRIAVTRKMVVWFAHCQLGRSYHWIGRKLMRDHSTIVYAVQNVNENWPQFESKIHRVAEMIGHTWVSDLQSGEGQ